MGTSNRSFSLDSQRNAQVAIVVSIALAISLISFSSLISPLLLSGPLSLITVIEMLVILGQAVSIVSGMVVIFHGNPELGILRVMYTFLVTGIFRVLVRESIGIPTGVITALVFSTTGALALPARRAREVALLAYGIGGAIILFDLYAGNFYSRQATPDALIVSTRNLAICIYFVQIIILISLRHLLSFTAKISSYFSLAVMFAVIAISASGLQLVRTRLIESNVPRLLALQTVDVLQNRTISTGVFAIFIATVVGLWVAHSLTEPMQRLSKTAAELEAGNLDARPIGYGNDEIGEVAAAFSRMADSLKDHVGQLSEKVQERTADLERRAVELQAAAEIGRAASTMRDLENLLERTVQLITERFNFYHAGVFLLDTAGDYAVLHAASSEGGIQMLRQGHRLKVGEKGIVGYVTKTGTARIALDVGQDAVYFDNPYLPNTHSEMALPLIAAGRILGALDVQSTEKEAFGENDIATLQILADQLAIAIQNARLLSEAQSALEAARVAYGEVSREAWNKIITNQPRVSYVASGPGTVQANTAAPTADVVRTAETGDVILSGDGHTIGIPIKIRGRAIGALRLKKQDASSSWTHDETTLAIALCEQLSGALESARLYRESQQRAAREALVSDISARITALPRVDTILRETVQELGQTFGNATITFQLVDQPDEQDQTHGTNGSGLVQSSNGKDHS
jgi:GAF domain-containing protein/HAMP domain-containing protein